MITIEINKKEFSNYLENLVGKRFKSVKDINKEIHEKTAIKTNLSFDKSSNDIEKKEGYDFCLKDNVTINGFDLCYLDIYFLCDHSNQMYITEIGVDFNT